MSVSAAPRAPKAARASKTSKVKSTVIATDTIVFPNGVVGQPDWKRFVLLTPENDTTIQVLKSIEHPELALMVTNPAQLIANYAVALTREERSILELDADE